MVAESDGQLDTKLLWLVTPTAIQSWCKRNKMSGGILQLTVCGRVLLQLEYRELKSDLRDLDCMNIDEVDPVAGDVPSFTAIFDSGYAEKLL